MRLNFRNSKKLGHKPNSSIDTEKKLKMLDVKLAGQYLQVTKSNYKKHKTVKTKFWPKFRRFIGKIPFADDLLAAYYCAFDVKTPKKVRGVLLAALAYFILPVDFVPDFIVGMGFTDDATVLMTAFGLVSTYIKDHHREQAQKTLDIEIAKVEENE